MMRKLDQRGVAALEFCLVAVPFVHIDVRHLRSRTLCNHHAVIADARECGCPGNDDQVLHTCRNQLTHHPLAVPMTYLLS